MTEEERTAYKEGIKVECEQCGKVLAHKFWPDWPDTFKLLTARPDISNVSSVTIKTTEAIT